MLHRLRFEVVGAHLHHGQRPEADRELELCKAFCEQLGIAFAAGRADVPKMSKELKIGLEEAGRNARYEFLRRAALQFECGLIATAHTRSDQVETVLLNLTRGTGLRGLSGIPERQGNVVRPLLAFTRDQTKSYCENLGLWTHEDPANTDLAFSRARIRHRVLPELKCINPSAEESIARLASIAGEEDLFLWAAAAETLQRCRQEGHGTLDWLSADCEVRLDPSLLRHLPDVLLRRTLRLAAESVGASLDFEQTATLEQAVREGGKGSLTAEGGHVSCEWSEGTLVFRQLQVIAPFRYPLTLPGETFGEEFGWQFTAYEVSGGFLKPERRAIEVDLNRASLKGGLYFRSAASGDSMTPLGFKGRRKLADLLSEAGLSRSARKRLPIVCDMIGPVWAPGVCLDDRAKTSSDAKAAIRIRFGPIATDRRDRNAETPLGVA